MHEECIAGYVKKSLGYGDVVEDVSESTKDSSAAAKATSAWAPYIAKAKEFRDVAMQFKDNVVASESWKAGYAKVDGAVKEHSGMNIGGAVEKHGVTATKTAIYTYGAYKAGFFDIASMLSKQAERQVESFFGVTDDASGVFDIPSMVVTSTPYKYTVATASKLPYLADNLASHALQGAKYSGITHVASMFSEPIKDSYNTHQYKVWGVAAAGSVATGVLGLAAAPVLLPVVGVTVPGAVLYAGAAGVVGGLTLGTNDQAHELGKGLETWFEHTMGLTGDEAGLLG